MSLHGLGQLILSKSKHKTTYFHFGEENYAENRFRKILKAKRKPHNLFSTYSIPNTAAAIILKHKPHHPLVQTLTLTKSQSSLNGLEGPYGVETQFPCIPICCDSPTFCLSSRSADHTAAGLNIIILSHLRAFECADPATWILLACIWLLPLETSFPQHSLLRLKSLLLISCLISLCVCLIHYSNT